VDVRTPVGELDIEQRKFVEIAWALSFGARFIVLDEPTAQLDVAATTLTSYFKRAQLHWSSKPRSVTESA
jgi:ABC-type sugar transport system ATPase subunit